MLKFKDVFFPGNPYIQWILIADSSVVIMVELNFVNSPVKIDLNFKFKLKFFIVDILNDSYKCETLSDFF